MSDELYLQRSPIIGKTLFPSPAVPRLISMSATVVDQDLTPPTGSGQNKLKTPKAPLAKQKTSLAAPPVIKSSRPYGFTLPRVIIELLFEYHINALKTLPYGTFTLC